MSLPVLNSWISLAWAAVMLPEPVNILVCSSPGSVSILCTTRDRRPFCGVSSRELGELSEDGDHTSLLELAWDRFPGRRRVLFSKIVNSWSSEFRLEKCPSSGDITRFSTFDVWGRRLISGESLITRCCWVSSRFRFAERKLLWRGDWGDCSVAWLSCDSGIISGDRETVKLIDCRPFGPGKTAFFKSVWVCCLCIGW